MCFGYQVFRRPHSSCVFRNSTSRTWRKPSKSWALLRWTAGMPIRGRGRLATRASSTLMLPKSHLFLQDLASGVGRLRERMMNGVVINMFSIPLWGHVGTTTDLEGTASHACQHSHGETAIGSLKLLYTVKLWVTMENRQLWQFWATNTCAGASRVEHSRALLLRTRFHAPHLR